jgi:hypothetical protein
LRFSTFPKMGKFAKRDQRGSAESTNLWKNICKVQGRPGKKVLEEKGSQDQS